MHTSAFTSSKLRLCTTTVASVVAALMLQGCAGKGNFESGVLSETEPCANNSGPWTGYNDFKTRNDDGTLTVYRCHFQQAVNDETACPGEGDPLCKANWSAIKIGDPSSTVIRYLGEPVKKSGIRWKYPNNNSVSIDDGTVINIFEHTAALYTGS